MTDINSQLEILLMPGDFIILEPKNGESGVLYGDSWYDRSENLGNTMFKTSFTTVTYPALVISVVIEPVMSSMRGCETLVLDAMGRLGFTFYYSTRKQLLND